MTNTLFTEESYASYKPLLFKLAYRMLGSIMDAEDIVQEAFLALQGVDAGHIANPKAYLCKIATNRCLDRLRSAQKQREVYVGPWLPEPIVADLPGGDGDPYQAYVRQESVSTAYLLLLQQLSWTERTVFLLREALQFDYEAIAEITGKSSQNCRQIFHRAKRSIHPGDEAEQALRPAAELPAQRKLVEQFTAALASGDVGKLLNVISLDATLVSDGGGKVSAAVRPIAGAARIVSFFAGVLKKLDPGFSYRLALVGGQPGLVTFERGSASSVFTFGIEQDRIATIYIVVNPDKLAGVH